MVTIKHNGGSTGSFEEQAAALLADYCLRRSWSPGPN
jgi:hypothetical protein